MAESRGRSTRGLGPRGRGTRSSRRLPGARPGVRPARAPAPPTADPTARHRFTGRAAVLVLVVAALIVSYASSMRAYLEQRAHVASLEASITESRRNIESLEREKDRWDDPAYVVSQARARFAFGFPGEVGYQVLDEHGVPLDPQDTLSELEMSDDGVPEWWETTVASIDAAAHPPDEDDGPATRIRPPTPDEPAQ